MPESLVFAAQAPAYVYQNVAFDATVKLVNEHKAKVTGTRKALQVALRYHDTYDLVEEQDAVLRLVSPSPAALDPASGTCQLSLTLQPLTAACDGRTFCLEVRATEADVESVFSSAVTVVKEKLTVVQQPPDVWFKDEGGREKCMSVQLSLVPAPGAFLEDRVVPLDVRLLYESGNPVLNQSILRLFPDMRPNMSRGRATVSFRIDDVSKNHQGQSFVLEIGPERQEGSSMFQDIAPTRTSIIAIRSKRNKRKLNAAAAAAAAAGGYGMRASPRSVTRTPPTNMMVPGASQMTSPLGNGAVMQPHSQSQSQRARKYMATANPMNYGVPQQQQQQHQQQMPMQQPMTSMSWSSHLMQPNSSAGMTQTQTSPQTPQTQQTPTANATGGGVVEWALGGFEIHPDGSVNTSRPIYRCPQCRRLNDVDMLAAGPALSHSSRCVFAPANSASQSGLLYGRSQMDGTPSNQQMQMQQQQRGYGGGYPQSSMPMQQSVGLSMSGGLSMGLTSTSRAPTTSSYGGAVATDSASLNVQQNTVNLSSGTGTSAGAGAGSGGQEGASPKTLAALGTASSQRPGLTISPYMNKVTTEAATTGEQAADSGNLFESNAFHNQMEMAELSGGDKLAFMGKNSPGANPALDSKQAEEAGGSLGGLTMGSALFNEMSSMGISLDQFDKGDAPLLGEFGGLDAGPEAANEEDQVFYILARMYTDAQGQKLGLPAFDQFQRMMGFYSEAQNDVQTQVVFHPLRDLPLGEKERMDITAQFMDELGRDSEAVHSLPKHQHNLIMLREDALMFYWSQSLV